MCSIFVFSVSYIDCFYPTEHGLFSLLELLDFGLLRSIDDPVQLRLNVINSGSKSVQIAVRGWMLCSMYFQRYFHLVKLTQDRPMHFFVHRTTASAGPVIIHKTNVPTDK